MVNTIIDFMDNTDWNFNRFINSLNIAFNYILEGIKSVRYFWEEQMVCSLRLIL